MRAPLLRVAALAAVACVVSTVGPAFGATGRTLAGVSCDTPPPVHCALDGCTREQLGNQGNAKEPKSGRAFFLDYPCDLKPNEPVVFLLSLHGAGSIGNWQRHYFPAIDDKEKYRLVVEGPPNYTNFRQFWKMFYDEGAVVVASSYTKVGGVYDFGFRHDPDKPLETLAEYCLGVYTNRSLPMRIDMLVNYINEYEADGLLINSIKSCNSFSAGQLLMMREVEKRTGKPAAFVESDLVDPRYFSAANIKNRLESYFQMIDQKRAGAEAAA